MFLTAGPNEPHIQIVDVEYINAVMMRKTDLSKPQKNSNLERICENYGKRIFHKRELRILLLPLH
ncbi:Protein of unknown function [Pyronema omphalodes CBS 100304]|uniref:Uncharacterized protein n=1 Tax=Pyronema omphalodes (strain CBS 100304) TaxID=1076935 RepID=U4LIM5_PYROM|nr:Protein of unknown function [Pyronema omphalodes CBS 100304]